MLPRYDDRCYKQTRWSWHLGRVASLAQDVWDGRSSLAATILSLLRRVISDHDNRPPELLPNSRTYRPETRPARIVSRR